MSPSASSTAKIKITPSPTLNGIEPPLVSGEEVIDVEEEASLGTPIETAETAVSTPSAVVETAEATLTPTAADSTPGTTVGKKLGWADVFTGLKYIFIACAGFSIGCFIYIIIGAVVSKSKKNKK